jgi:hypothetical protein
MSAIPSDGLDNRDRDTRVIGELGFVSQRFETAALASVRVLGAGDHNPGVPIFPSLLSSERLQQSPDLFHDALRLGQNLSSGRQLVVQ